MALAILPWNRLPQPLTRFFTSFPNRIRHHLTCLAAQGDPNPRGVRFFEYKRAQLVQFQCCGSRICGVRGEQGCLEGRKVRYFFLIQPDTVAREIPNVQVRPRRLLRSW